MRQRPVVILGILPLVLATGSPLGAQQNSRIAPSHFVFFGRDRDRISDSAFAHNPDFAGAQIKYTWRELEPSRDQYDFSHVLQDIARLESHRKRLFIQLTRLLDALGRAVDGRIEGIALSETAISFGESGRFHPAGFSYDGYAASIQVMMTAARAAFPRSHVIVYANFMPGEDPERRIGYLRAVYEHAERTGVGVGGPDLLPNRPFQRRNSLPLIAARSPALVAGMAVQDGNLADRKRNGERVTAAELYRYASDTLRADYIFWGTEEPYYSGDVIPFLRSLRATKQPDQVRGCIYRIPALAARRRACDRFP
jgi:hypothetical protein